MKAMIVALVVLFPMAALANPDGEVGSGWVEPSVGYARAELDNDLFPLLFYQQDETQTALRLGLEVGVVVAEAGTMRLGMGYTASRNEIDVETGMSDSFEWDTIDLRVAFRVYWGTR